MPNYDYRCEKCGTFEMHQSIKDDPLTACPTCGGSVKRLISNGVGIIFKGSGFYVTDNRSNGGSKSTSDEAKSEPSGFT